MRTTLPCLLAALLLGLSAAAQYEPYEPPKEASLPAHRHSLGLNLTPAAVILMNGRSIISRFSLAYTYQLTTNSRVRSSLNYEILDYKDESVSEATIVGITGNDITFQQDRIFHSVAYFRVGMEWHRPDQTFSMIYGTDLFAGMLNEQDNYSEVTWTLGPNGYKPSSVPNTHFEHLRRYLLVGGSVSIGQQIRVSDKLRFVFRWTPQFHLALPASERITNAELRTEPPTPKTSFRLRGVELYGYLSF